MFWAKQATAFVAGIFFTCIAIQQSTMYNGKINYSSFSCWVGIAIVVSMIVLAIYILLLEIIIVTDKGIVFKYLFFSERKMLPYDAIESIERLKVAQSYNGVQIDEGYHVSALNLKNGEQEIISPDKFDNYDALINAIRSNMNSDE